MRVKRLSGWDATFVYGEAPNIPVHTMKIVVIDSRDMASPFTFETFRRVVQRRLPLLDPLRYRLVDTPLKLHHPMWMENCEPDLDFHLRRARLPSPGQRRQFDTLICEIASSPLDMSRPLWECHFVDGLADEKVAVVTKIHHALADGGASANLLARALDSPAPPDEEVSTCSAPPVLALASAAGRDHGRHLVRLPRLVGDTAKGILRVRRQSRSREEHRDLARAFNAPPSFINHRVTSGRHFATASLAMPDVKTTCKHFGIKVNDLMLAIAAGALRELQLRYDGTADRPLIASVPVNTDPSPDRISGNAVGTLFVSLPVHVTEPLQRVDLIRVAVDVAKENNELLGPDLMGRWNEYGPPPLMPIVLRRVALRQNRNKLYNVSISNVRGPQARGRISGATISEFYSVGPLTPACGMNITVWSYVDQFNISVLTDSRTVRDAHEVTGALTDAFVEIRRAAGLPVTTTHLNPAGSQANVVER